MPPTPTPTVVPPPQIAAPVVMQRRSSTRRQDGVLPRRRERARKEEELRQARLRLNMLVADQSVSRENAGFRCWRVICAKCWYRCRR
ncbi:hypothetical protein ACOJBO_08145 [Rhizobium beringeri]